MADKPLPWFRLYYEAATDQKFDVISMNTGIEWCAVFGAWTKILCVAAASPVRGSLYVTLQKRYSNGNVTAMLRFTKEKSEDIMAAFVECDMLEIDEQGAYRVKNWDKRQYESDNSTKRVQKLRAGQKEAKNKADVTLHERSSNGDVTPPDTDTESDKYTTKISGEFSNVSGILPYNLPKWDEASQTLCQAGVTPEDISAAVSKLRDANMTISGLWSITKTAIAIHAGSNGSGRGIPINQDGTLG